MAKAKKSRKATAKDKKSPMKNIVKGKGKVCEFC